MDSPCQGPKSTLNSCGTQSGNEWKKSVDFLDTLQKVTTELHFLNHTSKTVFTQTGAKRIQSKSNYIVGQTLFMFKGMIVL